MEIKSASVKECVMAGACSNMEPRAASSTPTPAKEYGMAGGCSNMGPRAALSTPTSVLGYGMAGGCSDMESRAAWLPLPPLRSMVMQVAVPIWSLMQFCRLRLLMVGRLVVPFMNHAPRALLPEILGRRLWTWLIVPQIFCPWGLHCFQDLKLLASW